jgi:hypothetical protein
LSRSLKVKNLTGVKMCGMMSFEDFAPVPRLGSNKEPMIRLHLRVNKGIWGDDLVATQSSRKLAY